MSRKRRRVNKIKILRFILVLLVVIGGIIWLVNASKNDNFSDKKISDNGEKSKEEEKVKKLSLIMVGDNLIHDKIYNYYYNNGSYDFRDVFSFIKPIVSKYDLAYYNQETILGGSEIGVSSYPAFNSPYEVGDAMIDTGFNLVSLATNHTLDRGEVAVLNSRNYWNGKSDVLAVGSYSSMEERNKIEIREKNGIKYTMLNYTYGTNGIPVPSGKDYLVNIWPVTGSNYVNDSAYQSYKSVVKEDIERVRDKVDLLIVAMHWGVEYKYDANGYQEDAAKYLESLGVDIIIGTHPHVIEPITYINDTLVIYSLGNFISAHEVVNMGNRIGLMSSLDVTLDNNKITISNLNNELLYMYYTSDYKDFKIIPFSMMNSDYLSNYKDVYNEFRNIVTKLNSDISVVPIN